MIPVESDRISQRNMEIAEAVRLTISCLLAGSISSFANLRNRLDYEEEIIARELRLAGISKAQYDEWRMQYIESIRSLPPNNSTA